MKIITTLLLMLFEISSAFSSTMFKGEFLQLNSPYLVFFKLSDYEDKEKYVHILNLKTNQTDSLWSIEAKVLNDALYYCDKNSIKKRTLSQSSCNNDSIIIKTQFDIENFYIGDSDIVVAEIDSSYAKVNIMYYIDDKCQFRKSVPCHPEEMEWQISKIYSFEDYFVISVQYDLYVFDKSQKTLNKFVEGCPEFSMDQAVNIYYTQNSEDFLVKKLYVSNIKDLNSKREIIKDSGSIEILSYIVNNNNKSYSLINNKLYELFNQTLQPIPNIKFSESNGYDIIINQEEGNFSINY